MLNSNKENTSFLPPKEIIGPPKILINFSTEIHGKCFNRDSATDFLGNQSVLDAFELKTTPWARENIYLSNDPPEKAVSGKHIQVCAFSDAFSNGFSYINIEWFSEADFALQMGLEAKQWRKFPQVEMRNIDNQQNNIQKILKSGYPLFTTLANIKNMILILTSKGLAFIDRNPLALSTKDEQYFTIGYPTNQTNTLNPSILATSETGNRILKENEASFFIDEQTRNLSSYRLEKFFGLTGFDEQVVIDSNTTQLADFPCITEELIAGPNFKKGFETALAELKIGNKVIIIKKDLHETKLPVLIAQALSQILLQQKGSLISWTTQYKAFSQKSGGDFDFDLSFATREDLQKFGVNDKRLIIDLQIKDNVENSVITPIADLGQHLEKSIELQKFKVNEQEPKVNTNAQETTTINQNIENNEQPRTKTLNKEQLSLETLDKFIKNHLLHTFYHVFQWLEFNSSRGNVTSPFKLSDNVNDGNDSRRNWGKPPYVEFADRIFREYNLNQDQLKKIHEHTWGKDNFFITSTGQRAVFGRVFIGAIEAKKTEEGQNPKALVLLQGAFSTEVAHKSRINGRIHGDNQIIWVFDTLKAAQEFVDLFNTSSYTGDPTSLENNTKIIEQAIRAMDINPQISHKLETCLLYGQHVIKLSEIKGTQ